jgi:hypothetical protein
VNPTA